MSLTLPSSDSNDCRASVRFTRRSVGLGKKTSSTSETTSIVDSVVPGYKSKTLARGVNIPEEVTDRHREEIKRSVIGDHCKSGGLIVIAYPVKVFKDGACRRCHHTC